MQQNNSESFDRVKGRLDEIVEAVSDENISLDDALKLYEEAVQLGLAASSLLEENLDQSNAQYDEEDAVDENPAEENSDGENPAEENNVTDDEQVDTDSE